MKVKISSIVVFVSLVSTFFISASDSLAASPASVTSQVGITFIEDGEEPNQPGGEEPPTGSNKPSPNEPIPGNNQPGGGSTSGQGSSGLTGKLPQTNEKRNQLLTVIGLLIVMMALIYAVQKKKQDIKHD